MKLIGRIVCSTLLVICALFSFLFAFIELRSLLAGDFVLFNNAALGFFTYLFRFLFFLGLIAFAVFLIVVYLKKQEMKYEYYLIGAGLLLGSAFSVFFYSTYIDLIVILIALIPASTTLLQKLFTK